MLTAISALNESSNSESSSEDSNYEQDFQEEDYVLAYNKALGLYGSENFTSAERNFRKLLNSEYFKQCGSDSKRPQPVAKKLQFNTLRYLGIILGNNGSYQDAIDYLQRAISIDQTDVTVYFKLAYFAAKFEKYHLSRSALEESLYNQQHQAEEPLLAPEKSEDESEEDSPLRPTTIRHWPTLDLLITMTYKLGDFLACLRYISVAFHENSDYEKGHKIRKRIYDECPYLDPDPKNWNKEPDFSRIKWSNEPKPVQKEKEATQLTISQWNLKTLADTFHERYKVCGDTQLLLERCQIKYEDAPASEVAPPIVGNGSTDSDIKQSIFNEDDADVVVLESDDDIVILDDSDENDITIEELGDIDDIQSSMKKILNSVIDEVIDSANSRRHARSYEIIYPIVSQVANSVVESSTNGFIQKMLFNIFDSSVTDNASFISNLSSAYKRKAGMSLFLSEVPLDLIEKRRSTRAKGTPALGIGDKSIGTSGENTLSSPRCEEVTARQLLQGYFSSTLLNINYENLVETSSPMKKIDGHDFSQLRPDNTGNCKWLAVEEENELVKEFINKYCSTNRWTFLTQLEEFLITVVETVKDNIWPKELCDIFLRCYVKWRGHTVFPDEFAPQKPHRFIQLVIIANEILLQTKMDENSKDEEDECNANEEDGTSHLDIHFEEDLQHLIFNLFRVEPSQGVRILSLQLNHFKIRDKERKAIVVGDRLKEFLRNTALDRTDKIHSPVPSYQVFTKKIIDSFVENLEQKRLFSQICDLYDKREYALVRQILEANLPRKAKQKENLNIETRLFHLKMMIDTLWNLDDYEECIGWVEITLHETKLQMQTKNAASESLELTAKQYMDLLTSLECCLCMFEKENDYSSIEEPFRARLANNLLDLCLEQVEGKEEILDGCKTTLPWVLLYKLIAFEEQQPNNSQSDTVPGSISFICSAHDYLGQLSMCTRNDGRLLLLQSDAIVSTLFKGVKDRAMADQLRKNLDQAMYCLYAHPSKKSKLKHLVDHSVPNIALRWDRCMSPYQYLRPEKLPEYDDFKSNSILSETVLFFKRIVALIPEQFNLQGRNRSVKEYLTSGPDFDFPKFSKIPQKDRPLLDVLYLLADYYFKNNEFTTALEYYRYDLCFNQDRVDSWFPLALSLVNVLEQKLNETYKDPASGKVLELCDDLISRIMVDSDVIMKCYARCHLLSPKNSMICIESAGFAYTMHSFCTRQLDILDNLEENLKLKVKRRVPRYLDYSSDYYEKAFKLMEANDEPDEMWLLHFMKGKICEKRKQAIKQCLSEYMKALDMLLEQNAILPKKISYNSPTELSLELLEVYYRIHATILKQEFKESKPSADVLKYITDVLDKIGSSKIFLGGNPTSIDLKAKEDKLHLEDPAKEPPSKIAKLDESQLSLSWVEISSKCVDALEAIFKRFPQHFKSIHLFSKYHLKTTGSKKDIKKAQKYLWGNINTGLKNSIFSMALFGERKSNNLFNGIWRLPISEIDRAGSFSTHISKCMTSLLDLSNELKDQSILLEVAVQLRKPPDVNQKCLYEKQRKNIALKAYSMLKDVLNSKVDEHIRFGSSQESRLEFLFEIYQTYSKLRRLWQGKDDSVAMILADLFKSMGGNGTSDEVINFCTKVSSLSKKGTDNPQSLAAIVKGDPIEFFKKEFPTTTRHVETGKSSPISTAASNQTNSSKVSKLAAESSLPSTSAAAAMEYLNAASSYYSNELAKMAAYLQSSSGYTSVAEAQALLTAYAQYGLLDSVTQKKSPTATPSNKPKEIKDASKKIPHSTTQKSMTGGVKGANIFSHKPQSTNLSSQAKSNVAGHKQTISQFSGKHVSIKPTSREAPSTSTQPGTSSTIIQKKQAIKNALSVSSIASKSQSIIASGVVKTSISTSNKNASQNLNVGKPIQKKTISSKEKTAVSQSHVNMPKQKVKGNATTAVAHPKPKMPQSKATVQKQKNTTANSGSAKSTAPDDDDVICID